ncbi:hypothetical protein NEOLEDRAFT_1180350 [Neolentinus lepideus HHB14362 ss-1]|uniref:Uncharacterized protein n=1 Tax=Neolentinus lepideus HHB14362 ss-1 TaxID=1314782 RepID=A0A165R032_9AGAM|nr:hypothetical protein NEOLEDRAFT_1180350 [Neolentinus lepideus HHB14362 ss-1]
MKFFVAAVVSSLFAVATVTAECPEVTRFGRFNVSPTSLSSGDSVTINANFTCAKQLGYVATYTDYYIEVPTNNNGHEPSVMLARRQLAEDATTDSFTVQIPYGYYFPNASYVIALVNTYATDGTNGLPIYQVGGLSASVNITSTVS